MLGNPRGISFPDIVAISAVGARLGEFECTAQIATLEGDGYGLVLLIVEDHQPKPNQPLHLPLELLAKTGAAEVDDRRDVDGLDHVERRHSSKSSLSSSAERKDSVSPGSAAISEGRQSKSGTRDAGAPAVTA